MLFFDFPDKQTAEIIGDAGGDFQQSDVSPKSLSHLEVDAVLGLVLGALEAGNLNDRKMPALAPLRREPRTD